MNVATAAFNASVLTGEGAAALLNGDTNRYDMERGFTTHVINERTPGIVVEASSFLHFNSYHVDDS